MAKIIVQDTEVTVVGVKGEDYICITDLARYKNAEHTDDIIKNWIRKVSSINNSCIPSNGILYSLDAGKVKHESNDNRMIFLKKT